MKPILFLLLFALTLAACAPAASAPLAGELQIPLGQSRPLPGTDRPVEFVEVLEDSRCPADALCVWQGRVQVLLAVTLGTEQVPVILTLGESLEGDTAQAAFPDFTLTLTAVDPYPGTAADTIPIVSLLVAPPPAP